MRRVVSVVLLALLASGCGGEAAPEAESAPAAPTTTAVPDGAARSVEPTPDCAGFVDRLVGRENMYNVDFDSEADLARYPFEPIGAEAADLAAAIVAADDGSGSVDLQAGIGLLNALDAATLTPCDIPGAAALFLVISVHAHAAFCDVTGPSPANGSIPACGDTVVLPDTLPCFAPHPLGGYHIDDSGQGVTGGWEAVDCETGAALVWDAVAGRWGQPIAN